MRTHHLGKTPPPRDSTTLSEGPRPSEAAPPLGKASAWDSFVSRWSGGATRATSPRSALQCPARPAPVACSPCRCRRAGSAPPPRAPALPRAPARSSNASSPRPRPAASPRPPGGLRGPTAASGRVPKAARRPAVPARTSVQSAASCLLVWAAQAAPPGPAPCARGRARHLGSGHRGRKRPSELPSADSGAPRSAAPCRSLSPPALPRALCQLIIFIYSVVRQASTMHT